MGTPTSAPVLATIIIGFLTIGFLVKRYFNKAMECASCGKPATIACRGCKDSPSYDGNPPFVHYCNKACQKKDWQKHKLACQSSQARTRLYRVVALAQKLFYVYREMVWTSFEVRSVERSEDEVILHGKRSPARTTEQEARVFPSQLFSNKKDDQVLRKAVLSFNGCRDAYRWITEFLQMEGMLKGEVLRSDEMQFSTANDKLKLRMPVQNGVDIGGGVRHSTLLLELQSGEFFVIDLSGAQFGYPDPVMPGVPYRDTRIDEVYDSDLDPTPRLENGHCQLELLKLMTVLIKLWQVNTKLSLKSLFSLPVEEFDRKLQNLVGFIEWTFGQDTLGVPCTEHGKKLARDIKGEWVFDS